MKKPIDLSTIGGRLRDIRIKHKLTQENLAELISIEATAISKMENDRKPISIVDLQMICTQLGESADYIVLGKLPETTPPPGMSPQLQDMILALADQIRDCQIGK